MHHLMPVSPQIAKHKATMSHVDESLLSKTLVLITSNKRYIFTRYTKSSTSDNSINLPYI
jgi:hypothetical protein